jgi:hypothetical protein
MRSLSAAGAALEHAARDCAAAVRPAPDGHGARVLGFDSWTRGAHNFERLVASLAARRMTLSLVHLGSWGNDPGRAARERIGALELRDISCYGTNSLRRVLEAERPDAVILLSTETFAHRAVVRHCRALQIPTVLLYHGLVNVQVTDDERGSYGVNRRAHLKFVRSKFGKVLTRSLPCYVAALLRTGGTPREWRRLAADVLRLGLGTAPRAQAADDARTSACAVYTGADIEHAMRVYGFDARSIRVVGNPDLARFGVAEEMLGSLAQAPAARSREIMYIDTGLPMVGLVFDSRDDYFAHLRDTAAALAAQGYSMLLKAHPAHDPQQLQRGIAGANITLTPDATFVPRLLQCAACIAETTTLAMVPALLGMPLLLANYGALAALRYGPVLSSYPRGYRLEDLAQVRDILARADATASPEALRGWMQLNVGPLPAAQMPERVAELLAAVAHERPQSGAAAPLAADAGEEG